MEENQKNGRDAACDGVLFKNLKSHPFESPSFPMGIPIPPSHLFQLSQPSFKAKTLVNKLGINSPTSCLPLHMVS